MIITLYNRATDIKIILDEDKSKIGHNELNKSLIVRSIIGDIGLVAKDFTVNIEYDDCEISYECYCQGQLVKSPITGMYHYFDYGTEWYDLLHNKLMDILYKDPNHFLNKDNLKL